MGRDTFDLAAYKRRIADDTAEGRFLRRIPWVIDASPQDLEDLLRKLLAESINAPSGPCFSLVTPLWNTAPHLLEELILAVRCQSHPHWELVLVDDASPARDHLEIARDWAAREPRILLFELDENRGISGARNAAIARSS